MVDMLFEYFLRIWSSLIKFSSYSRLSWNISKGWFVEVLSNEVVRNSVCGVVIRSPLVLRSTERVLVCIACFTRSVTLSSSIDSYNKRLGTFETKLLAIGNEFSDPKLWRTDLIILGVTVLSTEWLKELKLVIKLSPWITFDAAILRL